MKLEHLNDYHKYYETILKYKACIDYFAIKISICGL